MEEREKGREKGRAFTEGHPGRLTEETETCKVVFTCTCKLFNFSDDIKDLMPH